MKNCFYFKIRPQATLDHFVELSLVQALCIRLFWAGSDGDGWVSLSAGPYLDRLVSDILFLRAVGSQYEC